jgi:hypothetical protein
MASLYLTFPRGMRVPLIRAIPFAAVHLVALAAFWTPFKWGYVALALAMYYFGMFFVTAGYHRYFSHRSFKTSRVFQFVLAFMARARRRRACCGGLPTIARITSSRIPKRTCTPRRWTASGGRMLGGS